MDQEYHQLTIKAMKQLCLMRHMLICIINRDRKHLRWVDQAAQCRETNLVRAAEVDKVVLNLVVVILVEVSRSVGRVAHLNSFIIVKFVKFLVPVSIDFLRVFSD